MIAQLKKDWASLEELPGEILYSKKSRAAQVMFKKLHLNKPQNLRTDETIRPDVWSACIEVCLEITKHIIATVKQGSEGVMIWAACSLQVNYKVLIVPKHSVTCGDGHDLKRAVNEWMLNGLKQQCKTKWMLDW